MSTKKAPMEVKDDQEVPPYLYRGSGKVPSFCTEDGGLILISSDNCAFRLDDSLLRATS
jgi:hypothetical protein